MQFKDLDIGATFCLKSAKVAGIDENYVKVSDTNARLAGDAAHKFELPMFVDLAVEQIIPAPQS